ncbi:hypothetical protein CEXT_411961 [Caerostris extrusa]|uniref:Uncharacterized protein n=1 Tax=Caerostris extrusa TaxID=172846 RepID=A0AAV4UI95_CAEEX|nr:hypothetical protein CEXT_411961 [Caerostris extrusa]
MPLMQVHAYVEQKVHRDLMIGGGKSVSELDNSREDHSSVPFLGGGWGRGRDFTATSDREGFPPLTIIEAVFRAPPRITTAPSPTPTVWPVSDDNLSCWNRCFKKDGTGMFRNVL